LKVAGKVAEGDVLETPYKALGKQMKVSGHLSGDDEWMDKRKH